MERIPAGGPGKMTVWKPGLWGLRSRLLRPLLPGRKRVKLRGPGMKCIIIDLFETRALRSHLLAGAVPLARPKNRTAISCPAPRLTPPAVD